MRAADVSQIMGAQLAADAAVHDRVKVTQAFPELIGTDSVPSACLPRDLNFALEVFQKTDFLWKIPLNM